ncbi:MAG: threonine ammonia-lyase, partial [Chloroflexota bacterium]|nr:threonine ammonia-lyase [Chloroflexota bacterium]
ATFSQAIGAHVFLKCENLQRTGSFKVRGAYYRLGALSATERRQGVIAASAGNHAQGVALAAWLQNIRATIFMPEATPLAKVAATEGYGALVRLGGSSFEEAERAAKDFQRANGGIFIHPFDDELVMAGQGTIALEILDQLPQVDSIIVPVGGGGLISGIATAAKALKPSIKIFGAEIAVTGAFTESLKRGYPVATENRPTIAEGVAVHEPGKLTFEIVRQLVDEVVSVDEEMISAAMVALLERAKLTVEGAGAVGLAALLGRRLSLPGENVVAVLSGGNVDINLMARIIDHGLATAGRYLIFETWLPDRPGELLKILKPLKEERANILGVEHRRPVSFPEVAVMLTVETRDLEHGERLLELLRRRGYRVNRLELGS